MPRSKDKRHVVRDALFLDIPYIVDSLFRHADYGLNRLHDYAVGAAGGSVPVPRAYAARPAFWLLCLVLLFAAYGVTVTSLCGVFGQPYMETIRSVAGVALVLGAVALWLVAALDLHHRIDKRFAKQRVEDRRRKAIVYAVLYLVAAGFVLPIGLFGASLRDAAAFDVCRPGGSWASIVQLGLLVLAVAVAALGVRTVHSTLGRIAWQTAVLFAMVGIIWFLPGTATATEASQLPYRHVFAVMALALAATGLLANVLVRAPFNSMTAAEKTLFRDALAVRELFGTSREDPELSPRRIFGGAVIGILTKPLQFLLLPAFAIILVPSGFIWHACLAGTFASVMLIVASNLTSRWDKMSAYLRRYFLLGTPLVASAAVIVIAALRLADVQYVSTILNVAPFGVLFTWMVMTYALAWWFESQVNSVLATRLLRIFADGVEADTKVIAYVPGPHFDNPLPRVECTHRYLLAHPLGQFIVLGWFRDRDTHAPTRAFNTYGFAELFAKLAGDAHPDAGHEVHRRVQLYFALVNLLVIGWAGLLWWHFGLGDRENTVAPVVVAKQGPDGRNVHLMALLRADPARPGPAMVVAASGGGTRAAIYTAVVLRGLHEVKADRDIVLLSGVSGGAVAAAYFFGHRDALVRAAPQRCDPGSSALRDPWDCFVARMAEPFIRDVMLGAGEWRIQSAAPLGMLLHESFARRLFADGKRTLGDEADLGLILNTTITGHPVADSPMLDGSFIFARRPDGVACEDFERPVAALAGGRLAFSNLRLAGDGEAFQAAIGGAPNVRLPFVLVRDGSVELARAAALSANFPPVFPNARVDLTGYPASASGCTVRSYYVTDGGAIENLGLVSALLALENALGNAGAGMRLRDIEIVLAEGSALDYDYRQDRGIGAATDRAKERLTGRLTYELLQRVQAAARAVDPEARITVRDFSLPRVFRSRGGFGTHWMFPENVRVTTPLAATLPARWRQAMAQYFGGTRYWVTLDEGQLLTLWKALFAATGAFCSQTWLPDPARDLTTVSDWICGRGGGGTAPLSPDATVGSWESFRRRIAAP